MKLSSRTKALFICISIVFFIYSVSLVVPFIFILVNSFNSNLEFIFDVWAFPKHFSFSNYKFVFENYNMGGMFANSLWVTIMGTLISMISCCVTAYVLARYKFHGSKILISVAMAAMIIPSLGTLSATYKLMRTLKLIDNIFGILVLYAGPFGTNFLLMYSYFKTVSWTYAEAAKMDGANNFTIFFRIMLPQARGGLIAVGFLQMIGVWNDYFTPFMYMPNLKTVATGLQDLSVNATNTGAYTQMFAAMFISILPLLILFAVFHKSIMENTISGGLKG